ncbi:hypothetical protein SAMN04515674_10846 [Pseudarcicella hirudinis]|uniref:Uncharacterized protein n=1 Tax=Pseudarcicella hirudinis TaxID=1079859 RepID=A0A1I5UUK0_9BACT|nr:hypothetical protein [Pseudarcicella hirudinis]SFP98396.1 hypothetical protein SAMN04515674_10846 [Pseudarcicella hirudinis]
MADSKEKRLIVRAVGSRIPNSLAVKLTKNYQKVHPKNTRGHLIGRDVLESFLKDERVHGIRVYHAYDSTNEDQWKRTVVILGVDENNRDIFTPVIKGRGGKFEYYALDEAFDAADMTMPGPPPQT